MILLGEKAPAVKQMSVKEELLHFAKTICSREVVFPVDMHSNLVWWANTTSIQPGLGVFIELTAPVTWQTSQITTARFITCEPRGESVLAIHHDTDPAALEADDYARFVCETFRKPFAAQPNPEEAFGYGTRPDDLNPLVVGMVTPQLVIV